MYKNRKNFVMTPSNFTGMLDNVLNHNWDNMFFDDKWSNVTVPVNIKETDKEFNLDVIAPGLKKEDFNINVEKDLLTISFENKAEKSETTDKVIRSEYQYRSFKRSFTLGEKINVTNIAAAYNNGILSISLPKTEEVAATTKKIEIV